MPDAPHTFLPINLLAMPHRLEGLPLLALVDSDVSEEILRGCWKTTTAGSIIFRQFSLRDERLENGHLARVREQLAHAVMGYPPLAYSFFENGDQLDCRRCNIRLAGSLSEARDHAMKNEPNVFVRRTPGYPEAVLSLSVNRAQNLYRLNRFRSSVLTNEQVLKVLNEIQSGFLRDATTPTIAEYIDDEFKACLSQAQIRLILRGESMRQIGFDYVRLSAARPTPQSKALERWKARQAKTP